MSFDPTATGPGPHPGHPPTDPGTAPTMGMREPQTSERPNVGVMTPHGRPGVYIYPFWQRSEFWALTLVGLMIAVAVAVDDGFGAQSGWTLIAILTSAYILSRGLAKREPRDDDDDRPWTPGGPAR